MRKEGVFSRKSNKSEKSRISQGQKKEPKTRERERERHRHPKNKDVEQTEGASKLARAHIRKARTKARHPRKQE